MRVSSFTLVAVASLIFLFGAATPSNADHLRHKRSSYIAIGDNPWACRGVWLPRYHFGDPDPFAYRYCPRGYYPYYNSGQWRSRYHVSKNRAHFQHPRYYPGWGANRRHYRHYRWHADHHGRHQHHHW